jgi:hypothetical protein
LAIAVMGMMRATAATTKTDMTDFLSFWGYIRLPELPGCSRQHPYLESTPTYWCYCDERVRKSFCHCHQWTEKEIG